MLRRRKKVLLVALDWTEVQGFHTLMARAVLRGHAVPLLWASFTQGQLHRSQNTFEESLLRMFVTMLPQRVRVIILADLGFGRAELAKTCHDLRVWYLIRIKPDMRVAHPSYTERLNEYPLKKGCWRVLAGAQYRSDKAVTLNVVIRWKQGWPKRRDEPWFLMTGPTSAGTGPVDGPVRVADGGRGTIP